MRYLLVLSFFLLLACGSGQISVEEPSKPFEFQVLTKGEVIELTSHARDGRITVFDFYADWCPPCKKLDKSLADLKKVYGDRVEIFKLDLVNWESELARHHGIKDLPYLIVYNEHREVFKKGPSAEVLPALVRHLNDR